MEPKMESFEEQPLAQQNLSTNCVMKVMNSCHRTATRARAEALQTDSETARQINPRSQPATSQNLPPHHLATSQPKPATRDRSLLHAPRPI
eukprot:1300073-Rhodomonas_salina.1